MQKYLIFCLLTIASSNPLLGMSNTIIKESCKDKEEDEIKEVLLFGNNRLPSLKQIMSLENQKDHLLIPRAIYRTLLDTTFFMMGRNNRLSRTRHAHRSDQIHSLLDAISQIRESLRTLLIHNFERNFSPYHQALLLHTNKQCRLPGNLPLKIWQKIIDRCRCDADKYVLSHHDALIMVRYAFDRQNSQKLTNLVYRSRATTIKNAALTALVEKYCL